MVIISVSGIIALLLSLILGVPYLDFLKKKLYCQFVREVGPASHASKQGTPTTGGFIILVSSVIASILALLMFQGMNLDCAIVLAVFILFSIIGFRDDYFKIAKKQNKGLSAQGKLLFQTLLALVPALYMYHYGQTSINFFDLFAVDLGIFYPIFAAFIIVGASNAVNLTDGLDGLAAGTSFFAFTAMAVLTFLVQRPDLSIISIAIAFSCVGFLYYNRHTAKVFMGDTGSLALGGVLATIAVIAKLELWLLIIGIIFIIETLSVVIQVTSFKTTGKRVFKMSPIHHHFELLGWSEVKVVSVFCTVGAIAAGIAVYLKYIL